MARLPCPVSPAQQPPPAQESPYVGLESRDIKSLSQRQIDLYLSGHGMGLALAAELNRYPGPKHVLELSDQLKLTREQKDATQAIYDSMHRDAA